MPSLDLAFAQGERERDVLVLMIFFIIPALTQSSTSDNLRRKSFEHPWSKQQNVEKPLDRGLKGTRRACFNRSQKANRWQ